MLFNASAILFAVLALTDLGDLMYNSIAELDHLPMAIISWSENPSFPSMVVIPILKEWDETFPIVV